MTNLENNYEVTKEGNSEIIKTVEGKIQISITNVHVIMRNSVQNQNKNSYLYCKKDVNIMEI